MFDQEELSGAFRELVEKCFEGEIANTKPAQDVAGTRDLSIYVFWSRFCLETEK